MTCGQERKCCWTGDLCLLSPLFWSWFLRGLFSEQLDDLGGRTLRSNNYTLTLLAYIISSGQPRSTTHPSHTKLLMEEMEGGSRRLWKPWQRVWTSGKDMCNLFNLVNHGWGGCLNALSAAHTGWTFNLLQMENCGGKTSMDLSTAWWVWYMWNKRYLGGQACLNHDELRSYHLELLRLQIRWECYRGVTLILAGQTCTSSLTGPGLIKKKN